ncbi:hypothetical protein MRB53_028726 [Persea americana]|uniref:Uncharacterized protein n=1 Tax=Persea americana TaxID=3435 RepID=A0ACC2KGQ2_PERAE|nr:hypothetical protein MRB53_028726 [Persea americana]
MILSRRRYSFLCMQPKKGKAELQKSGQVISDKTLFGDGIFDLCACCALCGIWVLYARELILFLSNWKLVATVRKRVRQVCFES